MGKRILAYGETKQNTEPQTLELQKTKERAGAFQSQGYFFSIGYVETNMRG